MSLAVILARGGSKRIPRKNIKIFAGKPMIGYAIEAARVSGLFQHVVVSTDDEEIAQIARQYGAEVPFTRPAHLADDYTPTVPVVAHSIEACDRLGWSSESVCCIYPCVPFIQVQDIADAFELLTSSTADYCFPVTQYPAPVQRALKRDAAGRMSAFFAQHEMTRTQDLQPAYHDAGQFYWGTRQAWLTQPRIHSNGVGLPIPGWRVVDIDTPEDWIRAESIFKAIYEI